MKRLILPATTAIALIGCSPHATRDSYEPGVDIPDAFNEPQGPHVSAPRHWWNAFDDEALNDVVLQAFQENLDLKQAWARLDQAQALATIQGAGRYPDVDLDASGSRSRQVLTDGNALYSNRFRLGLGLTWELDLWKKIANRTEAAMLLTSATRADAQQTALLLSGTVVELWFTIQEQEQLLDVLEEQVASSMTQLELTELRYGSGIGNALEVLQQRLQLSQVESEMPRVRSVLETSRNQLAVILGRPPQEGPDAQPEAVLPQLPGFPILPTPRSLLETRPDLRAAHDRVAAADREVAAAIADMLPTIRLSLEGAFSSPSISSLLDNTAGSIAGGLVQPIFDGDRRGAEANRRRAILQERTEAFSQQFLIALREIEDAIDRETQQVLLLRELEEQTAIAKATLTEARARFANGQSEYLDVISAIQSLQRVQRQEVTASKDLLSYRSALYLAIGGAWTRDLAPPTRQSAGTTDTNSPLRDTNS